MHFSRASAGDVLRLALPAVFEQVLVMLVFTLDTVMVGRYGGSQALAAIGVSAEMVATVSNIFVGMGISIATTSLVARAFGAGRLKRAEEYATLGILAAAASAFMIGILVFLFAGSAVRAAGAEAAVSGMASGYLRIVAFAIFFSMVLSSVNAVLRGYGNTKVPFVASAITTLTNLILDYGLIFGNLGMPELGVQGAAIATVIAQALGLTFSTTYMLRRSKVKPGLSHIQTLDMQRLKSFFRLSVPASMQEGSISLVRLLGQFMIIGLGTKALAANTMATMIESISFMPGWGFALAASALVGLKTGEGDHEGAKAYAYTSVIDGFGSNGCDISPFPHISAAAHLIVRLRRRRGCGEAWCIVPGNRRIRAAHHGCIHDICGRPEGNGRHEDPLQGLLLHLLVHKDATDNNSHILPQDASLDGLGDNRSLLAG